MIFRRSKKSARMAILWRRGHTLEFCTKVKLHEKFIMWKFEGRYYAGLLIKNIAPVYFDSYMVYFVDGADPHVSRPETEIAAEENVYVNESELDANPDLYKYKITGRWSGDQLSYWEEYKELADDYFAQKPRDDYVYVLSEVKRRQHSEYRVLNGMLGDIMQKKMISEWLEIGALALRDKIQFWLTGAGLAVLLMYFSALFFPEQFRALFGL